MEDKIITCVNCNEQFVFSVEEARRFAQRGFDEPRRCTECRKKKAKSAQTEDPWKDKGRKRHGKRRSRNDFDDEF